MANQTNLPAEIANHISTCVCSDCLTWEISQSPWARKPVASKPSMPASPKDVTVWTEKLILHFCKTDARFASRAIVALANIKPSVGSGLTWADAPLGKHAALQVTGRPGLKIFNVLKGDLLTRVQYLLPKYAGQLLALAKQKAAKEQLGPTHISVSAHNAAMEALSKTSCEDAG